MSASLENQITKVAKQSLISAAGSAFVSVSGPVVGVLTTRALGSELFGIYSLVQSLCALLANIASIGLNGATLRTLPAYHARGDDSRVKGSVFWTLKVSLSISTLFALFIILFPGVVCNLLIHYSSNSISGDQIETALRFYAISIPLTAAYLTATSSLQGLQAVNLKVVSNDFGGSAAKLLSLVILLFCGLDLYAAFGSNVIQDLAILSLSWFFLFKIKPALKNNLITPISDKKELHKLGSTLFANSFLNRYSFQLDLIFLGYFGTAAEVGLYAVALRLQPFIYLPHYTISSIFGPMAAELNALGKRDELGRLFKVVSKWSFSVSLPICATVVIFSKEILHVFGKDFVEAGILIVILSISNLIHDMIGLGGTVITMVGKIRWTLFNSICVAITNLTGYYFFIKSFGAVGAAVAYGCSVITLDLLLIFQTHRILGVFSFQPSMIKPVVSMGLSVLFITGLKSYFTMPYFEVTFIFYIILMFVVYFLCLSRLGFDSADRLVLKKVTERFPFLGKVLRIS